MPSPTTTTPSVSTLYTTIARTTTYFRTMYATTPLPIPAAHLCRHLIEADVAAFEAAAHNTPLAGQGNRVWADWQLRQAQGALTGLGRARARVARQMQRLGVRRVWVWRRAQAVRRRRDVGWREVVWRANVGRRPRVDACYWAEEMFERILRVEEEEEEEEEEEGWEYDSDSDSDQDEVSESEQEGQISLAEELGRLELDGEDRALVVAWSGSLVVGAERELARRGIVGDEPRAVERAGRYAVWTDDEESDGEEESDSEDEDD